MTLQASFSQTEWKTLQFLPLAVFSAVAGADGKVSRFEKAQMAQALEAGSKVDIPDAELFRDVAGSLMQALEPRVAEFTREVEKGLTLDTMLAEAVETLAKAPASQADMSSEPSFTSGCSWRKRPDQ
jgi:hypothetical protein